MGQCFPFFLLGGVLIFQALPKGGGFKGLCRKNIDKTSEKIYLFDIILSYIDGTLSLLTYKYSWKSHTEVIKVNSWKRSQRV